MTSRLRERERVWGPLPGVDGVTATRAVRALDPDARGLPIVAMTANVLPAQVAEFRAAGFDGHLGKPFRRDEFLVTIARWIDDGPAAPGTSDAPGADALDRAAHEELRNVVGTATMMELVGKLALQLVERLDQVRLTPDDPCRLAREAHAVVSTAGTLGFRELSAL